MQDFEIRPYENVALHLELHPNDKNPSECHIPAYTAHFSPPNAHIGT